MLFLVTALACSPTAPRSNCPNPTWLKKIHLPGCEVRRPSVLVIGGNKGYDCVGWLRFFWSGNETPSSQKWSELLPNKHPGVCHQGSNDYPISLTASEPPVILCVEPMPANFNAIKKAAQHYPNIKAIQVAATLNTQKKAFFPNGTFGAEVHGISSSGVPIITKTVDDIVNNEGVIPHIMSIDTEGNDAFVLLGAAHTLATGKVKYIEFEYHKKAPWSSYKLEWVIDFLDNLHYDCYWAANQGFTQKITGCWVPAFEFHVWSNVVCAHRRHTCWHRALENAIM